MAMIIIYHFTIMLVAINVTISISRNNALTNHSIAFKDINAAMYKDNSSR
jgi:hypothetical protein